MIDESVANIIRTCLWGNDLKSLDPLEADKFLIIERILEHGSDRQIKFVMATYKKEDMISVIKESSYLGKKTVNYWCLSFGLRKEETRCYERSCLMSWVSS